MLTENRENIKNLFMDKKYVQVRKLVSELIPKTQNKAELYSIRGRAFRYQHMYKQAHKDFMQAYHLNKNSVVCKEDAYQSIVDKTFDELVGQYSDKCKRTHVSRQIVQILCSAQQINTSLSDINFEKLILNLAQQNISHDNLRRIIIHAQCLELRKLSELDALNMLHSMESAEKTEIIKHLANDSLFHFILNADFNTNFKLEFVIRALRRELFLHFEKYGEINGVNKLLTSMSKQMLLNEFIYDETNLESKKVRNIESNLERNKGYNDFDVNQVALLSMYKDISKLPGIHKLNFAPNFCEIKKAHVSDKMNENEIIASMKISNRIADETSKIVKQQYEENPYPRWQPQFGLEINKRPLKEQLEKAFNVKLSNKILDKRQKNALVAGCGTGQQIYYLTRCVNDIAVDAFDLSFSSLAYAQRVISEVGIQNVQFRQGDILNAQSIYEKKFDYIECGGVLHHMKNPELGLKQLSNILNKGGFLFLGLYSRKARQIYHPIKAFIKKGMGAYNDNSKFLREALILNAGNGNREAQDILTSSRDLYCTSGYRDLLFHSQEHEYDLLEIERLLDKCSLRFVSMADGSVKNTHLLQAKELPKTLSEWNRFESDNPNSFPNMYQFLTEKI